MFMQQDWRLNNQLNYLLNKTLKKVKFVESTTKDHEHCSFCWEKFGDADNLLQIGYCTEDKQHWVCEQCFEDFKEKFQWIIKT